jgi:hypothetical protein
MFLFGRSSARGRVAVLLHDGGRWHGAFYSMRRGGPRRLDEADLETASTAALPASLLRFARKLGARRVRVLVPADVHQVTLDLPDDLDPEEMQTAVGWEVASSIGMDAGAVRVAAARLGAFALGDGSGAFLAAAFETKGVARYAADCAKHKLRFEGVGSLQLATLAWHRHSATQGECLLLMRRRSTFGAVTSAGDAPLTVRNVPFGPPRNGAADPEWDERLARRLGPMAGRRIRLVASHHDPEEMADRVAAALGDADVRSEEFHAVVRGALAEAALSTVGTAAAPCALVGVPPVVKDPRRAGTWVAALLVLAAAGALGYQWDQLTRAKAHLETQIQLQKQLEAARSAATAKVETMNKQLADQRKLHGMLVDDKRFRSGIVEVLGVLCQSMPRYTRVTRIREEVGALVIEGRTLWQEGVAKLATALDQGLRPRGLRVLPGRVAAIEGKLEHEFTYRVVPAHTGRQP